MIQENIKKQIIAIWDKYIADNKKVQDTKGNDIDNIDRKRIDAIETLKMIIDDFLTDAIDIAEFKTDIDSFNKRNNLWGFTSVKGQMFFNLLLKTCDGDEQIRKLSKLLKDCIIEPKNVADALNKIEIMEKYTSSIFNKALNKRKAPNPRSVCYFLSYFWQIQNYQQWPVMYSSMIVSLTDIGLWQDPVPHKEAYNTFYKLNEEIKQILSNHTGRDINNWEAEHAFWNYRTVTAYPKKEIKIKITEPLAVKGDAIITGNVTISTLKVASFNINDYLLPIISNLIELGKESESSSASKGREFEIAVCEVFRQLGFTVTPLGQGTGREPDLIATHKEENVAFIVDAKAYQNGYALSANAERAIREYINHYCPKLRKEGIIKIGFIIVSNSFKLGFENFINEITWNTEIKRFSLLTSEALLHLLAYKSKDQIQLTEIIDAIINTTNPIIAQPIIEKFDDI